LRSRILDDNMNWYSKKQVWKTLVVFSLLLALAVVLLPNPHHLNVSIACPLLVVVFLFGTIDAPVPLGHLSPVNEECSFQSPDLLFRFQRPPPALI
jgi:hypothetical protein